VGYNQVKVVIESFIDKMGGGDGGN